MHDYITDTISMTSFFFRVSKKRCATFLLGVYQAIDTNIFFVMNKNNIVLFLSWCSRLPMCDFVFYDFEHRSDHEHDNHTSENDP